MTRPTLFLLHALGSSGREWREVAAALGGAMDLVALDLPGFGDNRSTRTDVATMVNWLADEIRAHDPAAYMLAGHSMGGKIVTLLAARAEAGEQGLSALAGVILLAASPPSPEPMDEARRAEMIGWCNEGSLSPAAAETFVDANTAARLPDPLRERAIADVERSSPHAWRDWLERGSREDWSDRVGRLSTPALILAGADDGDLGEAAQRELNAPHYHDARVEVVADAAHLLPDEQPDRVADLIAAHWARVRHRTLPADWAQLLASERVSRRTRAALLGRIDDPRDDEASCLDVTQRTTLAAIIGHILPGCGSAESLARRLDYALAAGEGDGWRFADLPPDGTAWVAGLDALGRFTTLSTEGQAANLERIADGNWDDGGSLSATQMRHWFEDVRAEAVRLWLAQPAALARIGYTGFANGGDGERPQGFTRTSADDHEPWEPAPAGDRR